MKNRLSTALLLVVCALPGMAQSPGFDTSGNGLLKGTYYFRHVIYAVNNQVDQQTGITGEFNEAIAIYGNITFDGNGNYSTGSNVMVDDSANASQVTGNAVPVSISCYLANKICTTGTAVTGTYGISANGYGFLSNPILPNEMVWGLVSSQSHVFVASSTETTRAYNDILIAAPLASPLPSNGTFQGSYAVAGYFPAGSPANAADAFFQMNPDGAGNLGTVNVTGYFGGGGTNTISQSNSGLKYFFSGGAAVVTWPNSQSANFFVGQEYLYFTPDGNFFFGGSPAGGYDMLVGVRNSGGTQNFSGLFYQAGLDQDFSSAQSTEAVTFDGFFGSFTASNSGVILAHDRFSSVFDSNAVGWTYTQNFTPPAPASYTDAGSSFQFAIGSGGDVRIGAGIWPFLGLRVAVRQPPFTPSGSVYIDPTGVVNSASFAPFSAGIAPNEYLVIFGSGLAAGAATAKTVPLPTSLGNVQVLVDGTAAPIYYVTPNQLSILTPAGLTGPFAQIQVINNGAPSNVVTVPVNVTSAGVFTLETNGIGHAAAEHADFSVISPAHPAAPGETISIYLEGLGDASAVSSLAANIGGAAETITFAGEVAGLPGLYQVNLTVPLTLTPGDYRVFIFAPDSRTSESVISVGNAAGSASAASVQADATRAAVQPRARAQSSRRALAGASHEAAVLRRDRTSALTPAPK